MKEIDWWLRIGGAATTVKVCCTRGARSKSPLPAWSASTVHVPTPDELSGWQIATRRTYAQWKAQINPGLISKAEEIVAKVRKA